MTSRPGGDRASAARLGARPPAPAIFDQDRRVARFARLGLLAATDFVALILAGVLAYAIYALPVKEQSLALYLELLPLISLFLLGYAQSGLYPGFGLGPVETLRRQSYVTAFGYLVLAAFTFALKLPHLYSRVTFVISIGLSLLLVPLARSIVVGVASRWRWWNEPVVIVGTGERAARAIRSIQHGHLGYKPIAILTPHPAVVTDVQDVPVAGDLDSAPDFARRGVRVALITDGSTQDLATIDHLQRHFRHVILLREYDDLPVEGIQIRALGSLVGIEYTNNLLLAGNRAIKRALDLIIASVALLIAAPIFVAAAALVRLIDGAPILFSQSRAGIDGRRIDVPKIRTMKRDAEQRLNEFLTSDSALRAEWDARHKLKNDPRLIPFVGRLFRRFSVDELPQLWSVVRGDMSLVGPRPFPDYHLAKFSPSFLELRQRVRPGITGLWQVEIRSEGSIAEQEAYDSYYIRNWSVWLDVYVLARTVAAVAAGRGAY
jgi:Undecaprenyl-phosphate galactose phosphotransferase WbaP